MSHLKSPSTWIALIALAMTLTGTAVAAGLITGKQVKNSSLTGADIKNGTLTIKDLKKGTIPAATKGDPGPTGPAGPAGPAGATGGTPSGATFTFDDPLSGSLAIVGENGDITVTADSTLLVTAVVTVANSSGSAKTVSCQIDYQVTNTRRFKSISSTMNQTVLGSGSAAIAMTGLLDAVPDTYDPVVRCSESGGSGDIHVPNGDITATLTTDPPETS